MTLSDNHTRHPDSFDHHTVLLRGLQMHYVAAGQPGAPLIILLHGFPDFWYGWRYQIDVLAAAGYYVVAPDQRGYNLTDKQGPYDVFTLSDDIVNLIAALGYPKAAAVIGHDWGGIVTWTFGARYPELVDRLAVCNVPHVRTMTDAMRELYWPQIRRSWYMGFFQLPALPEALLSANNSEAMADLMRVSSHGIFSEAELDYYRIAWQQPMAMQGMLGWYRTLFRTGRKIEQAGLIVHRPSLLIWGDDDVALTKFVAERSRRYIPALTIQDVPGASHWVHLERPAVVNEQLIGFLHARS